MNPQIVYYIAGATGTIITVMVALGGLVWNLSSKVTTSAVEIKTIKENHLAHVQKDIDEIKSYHKMFIEYLLKGKQ